MEADIFTVTPKGDIFYVSCDAWRRYNVQASFALKERADEYALRWTKDSEERNRP